LLSVFRAQTLTALLGLAGFAGFGLLASCDTVGAIGGGLTGAAGTGDPPAQSDSAGAPGASAGASGAAGSGGPSGSAGTAGPSGAAGNEPSGAAGRSPSGAAGSPMSGVAGSPMSGAAGSPTSGAAGSPPSGAAGAKGTAGVSGTAGASGAAGAPMSGAAGSTLPPVTLPHCKRGEAYQSNSVADLQALSKGMSWWYNWTIAPEKAVAADFDKAGVEFVPMVWGANIDVAAMVKQIPASSKYILGFNEPNFGAQSHIPAAMAASLWPKIEDIARQKNLKIGSPAPNYCAGDCNDTDPIHYLDTFFAACPGCKVDFIAVHWYACTGDALKNYLSKVKKYGKPIWLTEFSCMDAGDHSAAGEQAYMKTAVDILEKDPMIFRYAWFTGRFANPSGVSLLGAGAGQLTDLGNLYMTLPASGTCGN
jgi:Glycosyl hydrolase catalytic core